MKQQDISALEPAIFDRVIVTYRDKKQIFHPWETTADISFLLDGARISRTDCISMRRRSVQDVADKVSFPVPTNAVVFINGKKASWKSKWNPGDHIEFRKPSRRRRSVNSTDCAEPAADADELLSLKEAAGMARVHPQTAKRWAKKQGLLRIVGKHPVVESTGWRKYLASVPKKTPSRRLGNETASKNAVVDENDDWIVDYFDRHPGQRLSTEEIVAKIQKASPGVGRVDVVRVLKAGQRRGDYGEDDDGKWFRTEPE
jgi:hypothetical protein